MKIAVPPGRSTRCDSWTMARGSAEVLENAVRVDDIDALVGQRQRGAIADHDAAG